jgi:hypothetical protein
MDNLNTHHYHSLFRLTIIGWQIFA